MINLGSDRPVRLMEIVRLLEELVGQKAIIEHHRDIPPTLTRHLGERR